MAFSRELKWLLSKFQKNCAFKWDRVVMAFDRSPHLSKASVA